MKRIEQSPVGWMSSHCPNPNCRFHNPLAKGWRFKKSGAFARLHPPHRIQRFHCLVCQRSFSTQTFSTTCWQKRPDLDRRIFMKTVGGMANRQIARDLGVSPKTIDDRLARLGRHCMLFHWKRMQNAPPVRSLVVNDEHRR